MTGHPDPGILAELREGLLGRRRAARIRAHLACCPRCAALDSELAELPGLLASASAPQMPGNLVARLDAALAAEAAARQPGQRAVADRRGDRPREARRARGSGGRAARPADRPSRGWRAMTPRAVSAVAAGVLLLAGAGYGVSWLVRQPGGSAVSSAQAAGRAAHAKAAAPGDISTAYAGVGSPSGHKVPGKPATALPLVHSGTDYQPGRLAAQVRAVLTRYPDNASSFGVPARASLLAPPAAAVTACVRLITGGAGILLVDQARYRGQPATIIVRRGAAGRPDRVWVAGAGCPAAGRDLLAQAMLPGGG